VAELARRVLVPHHHLALDHGRARQAFGHAQVQDVLVAAQAPFEPGVRPQLAADVVVDEDAVAQFAFEMFLHRHVAPAGHVRREDVHAAHRVHDAADGDAQAEHRRRLVPQFLREQVRQKLQHPAR
jgi:hypothetical protein